MYEPWLNLAWCSISAQMNGAVARMTVVAVMIAPQRGSNLHDALPQEKGVGNLLDR